MEPGKRSAPGALPGSTRVRFFDAFWHRFGDFEQFWGPLKIQGGAKTVQEIQYGDVWASGSGPKAPKSRLEGIEKQIDF